MYLIDSSVWIDFLRGNHEPEVALLDELLADGSAYLCEVTFAEICFGAKDKRQLNIYQEKFGKLPFLNLPEDWHSKIAEMGFFLRSSGHKPFIADLMIALVAIEHQVPLLTTDKDFNPYTNLFGLRIG